MFSTLRSCCHLVPYVVITLSIVATAAYWLSAGAALAHFVRTVFVLLRGLQCYWHVASRQQLLLNPLHLTLIHGSALIGKCAVMLTANCWALPVLFHGTMPAVLRCSVVEQRALQE